MHASTCEADSVRASGCHLSFNSHYSHIFYPYYAYPSIKVGEANSKVRDKGADEGVGEGKLWAIVTTYLGEPRGDLPGGHFRGPSEGPSRRTLRGTFPVTFKGIFRIKR